MRYTFPFRRIYPTGTEDGLAPKHDPRGMLLRLELLAKFLESMPDEMVRVAFSRGQIEGSLMLVGDWFAVEAVVPHYAGGYRHSTSTEHGPTVLHCIEQFESELLSRLDAEKISPDQSRLHAIAQIKEIIKKLE